MNNYDDSLKNYDNALNAAGQTQKKYDTYLESSQAHIDELTTSMQGMWQDTMSSEQLKTLIDFGTGIVNIIDKIGLLNIAAVALFGILGGRGILTTVVNLIPLTKSLALNIGILASNMGVSEAAAVTLAKSLSVMVPVAAILAGIAIIDYLTEALDRQKESVADLSNKIQTLTSERDSLNQKMSEGALIDSESKRLELLNAEITANQTLLKQEDEKLYKMEQQSNLPTTNQMSWTSYYTTDSGLKSAVDEYNSLNEATATTLEQQDEMKTRKAELIKEMTTEVGQLQAHIDLGTELTDVDAKRLDQMNAIIEAYNKQTEAEKAADEAATETQTVQQKLAEQFSNGEISLKDYISKLNALKASSKEYEVQAYNLGEASTFLASISDKVTNAQSLTEDEVKQLTSLYPDLQGAIYETADGWSVEKTAVDLLNTSVTSLQTAYMDAQNAMTELAAISVGERLNITDTELAAVQSVADAYATLAGKKSSTGTGYTEHELKMLNINDPTVMNTLALGKARETINALKKNLGSINTKALDSSSSKSSSDEYDWFDEMLSTSKQYIENRDLYGDWDKYGDSAVSAWERIKKYTEQYYKDGKISYEKYADVINDIDQSLYTAKKDAIQSAYEAEVEYQQKLIESQKDALETELEATDAQYDKHIAKLQKKLDALKDEEEEQDKLLAIEEAREDLENAKSDTSYRVYSQATGWQWTYNQSAVDEAQEALDDAQEEYDDYEAEAKLEKQISKLEKAQKKNEENINAQIDDLDALAETWENSLDISADTATYTSQLDALLAVENSSYASRLEAAQAFATAYKKALNGIGQTSTSSTTTTTSTTSTTSADSTNVNTYGEGGHVNTPQLAVVGDTSEWIIPDSNMPSFVDLIGSNIMNNMLSNITASMPSITPINRNTSTDSSSHMTIQNMTIQANNPNQFANKMKNLVAITGNMTN